MNHNSHVNLVFRMEMPVTEDLHSAALYPIFIMISRCMFQSPVPTLRTAKRSIPDRSGYTTAQRRRLTSSALGKWFLYACNWSVSYSQKFLYNVSSRCDTILSILHPSQRLVFRRSTWRLSSPRFSFSECRRFPGGYVIMYKNLLFCVVIIL